MTQAEVAAIMRISERTVHSIEKRALEKLHRHAALRELWREWTEGEIKEAGKGASAEWTLSRAEIAAVYALTRTPEEQRAVRKLIGLVT